MYAHSYMKRQKHSTYKCNLNAYNLKNDPDRAASGAAHAVGGPARRMSSRPHVLEIDLLEVEMTGTGSRHGFDQATVLHDTDMGTDLGGAKQVMCGHQHGGAVIAQLAE